MHVRSVISKQKNLKPGLSRPSRMKTLHLERAIFSCGINANFKPLFVALTFWVSFASFHALFGVKVSVPLHDSLHENYLGFSKDTTAKQIVNLV